jgi:antitoxin-like ribbon-helix-helix protein
MASKMADIQRQLERTTGRQNAARTSGNGLRTPDSLTARPTPTTAPSRVGKIHIGAYLHPDFKASLRLVQARTGRDIQGLLADALNELFRAHNAPVVDG